MRSTLTSLAAVAALTLTLSACGGEESTDASAPSTEATSAEEPTEDDAAMTSEDMAAATTEEETTAAEETETEESQAGGAGGLLSADALSSPPEQVGDYALADDSGPALIYETESGDYLTMDTNALASPYEDMVAEIETDNVEAGTGSCGLNSGGTSAVCYQRTEDGVITMTADADALEELAGFADEFAAAGS